MGYSIMLCWKKSLYEEVEISAIKKKLLKNPLLYPTTLFEQYLHKFLEKLEYFRSCIQKLHSKVAFQIFFQKLNNIA